MRENAASKARRYLSEGRVILTLVGRNRVEARVRGDGAIWTATFRAGRWDCSCPALTDQCCHLRAVRLVTAPDIDGFTADSRTPGNGDASYFEARQ